MKKILLLGSAPYIGEWYERKGASYRASGYLICPINNAWSVCQNHIHTWYRSEDYFYIPATMKPSNEQRESWNEVVEMLDFPFYYQKRGGGGTILLNVLCHLMNAAFSTKTGLWLSLAGCDLIYKGSGKDWFYGKGTPDPMRLGEKRLRDILIMLKELAEKFDCVIANAGGQEETLLPFARHEL